VEGRGEQLALLAVCLTLQREQRTRAEELPEESHRLDLVGRSGEQRPDLRGLGQDERVAEPGRTNHECRSVPLVPSSPGPGAPGQ
jgi:hypothetical protein